MAQNKIVGLRRQRITSKTIFIQDLGSQKRVDMTSLAVRLKRLGAVVENLPFFDTPRLARDTVSELMRAEPGGMILVWGPNLERAAEAKEKYQSRTEIFGVEFGWLPQREWLLTDDRGMWCRASTRNLVTCEKLQRYQQNAVTAIRDWYRIEVKKANWNEDEYINLKLPRDFLFVPLQLAKDKAVRRGMTKALQDAMDEYHMVNDPYRVHIALLSLIARNIDLPIVARPHPLDCKSGGLDSDQFAKYLFCAGLSNRVSVVWESSSYTLIKLAKAVAGISSTMLVESLAIGTPAAVIGESFVAGSMGLFDARDPQRLRAWNMTYDVNEADGLLWELIRRQIPCWPREQIIMRSNPYVDAVLKRTELYPEQQTAQEKYEICRQCPWSTEQVKTKFGLIDAIGRSLGQAVKTITGNEPLRCSLCGCFSAVKARTQIAHCPMGAW